MELFLDTTPKSKFLSLLSSILHLTPKAINPITLSPQALNLLKADSKFTLPSIPCLITLDNMLTSILSISSYFVQITSTEQLLFNKPQEIISVIEFLERKSLEEIINYFNEALENKSFLVGNHITLADIALFSYLQSTLVLYTDEKKWAICNLYRWFLHIQSIPNIKQYLFDNQIQLALKPKPIIEEEKSKSQLKKEAKKQQKAESKQEKKDIKSNQQQKEEKKQQQQPKQPQQAKPSAAPQKKTTTRPKITGEVNPSNFYIFDIRIANLTSVWKHSSSDKLYCEKISTGEKTYDVASGLQQHIPIENMKGLVVLLTNLKERKLAGFTSQGMILCASNSTHEKIEILRLENDNLEKDLGQRVLLEGVNEEGACDVVADKDGVVGKLLDQMKVDKEGYATFCGKRWIVNGKFIKTETLKECNIS